ncbi:MAG: hypothetical protein M3Y85_00895 [Bacteroidota bacterium]|nr:hypothetical protein [Bacteroidota bacterium]
MKDQFKYIPQQIVPPASIMEVGVHGGGYYGLHSPRAPDINDNNLKRFIND